MIKWAENFADLRTQLSSEGLLATGSGSDIRVNGTMSQAAGTWSSSSGCVAWYYYSMTQEFPQESLNRILPLTLNKAAALTVTQRPNNSCSIVGPYLSSYIYWCACSKPTDVTLNGVVNTQAHILALYYDYNTYCFYLDPPVQSVQGSVTYNLRFGRYDDPTINEFILVGDTSLSLGNGTLFVNNTAAFDCECNDVFSTAFENIVWHNLDLVLDNGVLHVYLNNTLIHTGTYTNKRVTFRQSAGGRPTYLNHIIIADETDGFKGPLGRIVMDNVTPEIVQSSISMPTDWNTPKLSDSTVNTPMLEGDYIDIHVPQSGNINPNELYRLLKLGAYRGEMTNMRYVASILDGEENIDLAGVEGNARYLPETLDITGHPDVKLTTKEL